MNAMTELILCEIIGETLSLRWKEGGETHLPLSLLRENCPCALCAGEPDAFGRVVSSGFSHKRKSSKVISLEVVGSYGIKITWKDSHQSGIFSYDLCKSLEDSLRK